MVIIFVLSSDRGKQTTAAPSTVSGSTVVSYTESPSTESTVMSSTESPSTESTVVSSTELPSNISYNTTSSLTTEIPATSNISNSSTSPNTESFISFKQSTVVVMPTKAVTTNKLTTTPQGGHLYHSQVPKHMHNVNSNHLYYKTACTIILIFKNY